MGRGAEPPPVPHAQTSVMHQAGGTSKSYLHSTHLPTSSSQEELGGTSHHFHLPMLQIKLLTIVQACSSPYRTEHQLQYCPGTVTCHLHVRETFFSTLIKLFSAVPRMRFCSLLPRASPATIACLQLFLLQDTEPHKHPCYLAISRVSSLMSTSFDLLQCRTDHSSFFHAMHIGSRPRLSKAAKASLQSICSGPGFPSVQHHCGEVCGAGEAPCRWHALGWHGGPRPRAACDFLDSDQ